MGYKSNFYSLVATKQRPKKAFDKIEIWRYYKTSSVGRVAAKIFLLRDRFTPRFRTGY